MQQEEAVLEQYLRGNYRDEQGQRAAGSSTVEVAVALMKYMLAGRQQLGGTTSKNSPLRMRRRTDRPLASAPVHGPLAGLADLVRTD
jgi:hypothetical protein